MANLAKLITASSYVAGFGFAAAGILKFKAHKDNPTQVPLGAPVALVFFGAALIFFTHYFWYCGRNYFRKYFWVLVVYQVCQVSSLISTLCFIQ